MATKDDLTAIERQWVLKSLQTQRDVLRRSLAKEMVGSDIHRLRSAEIEQLQALIGRFS